MAACGSKCPKYSLFTFNLIFFICALTVLGIGIWMLVDKSSFAALTAPLSDSDGDLTRYSSADSVVQQAAYLFIASGIIGLIVAFLGCCGAIKEWRPLLITYAVLLLLIMGLEIAAGIYAGVFRNTANDYVVSSNIMLDGHKSGGVVKLTERRYNDPLFHFNKLTTMQTTLRKQYATFPPNSVATAFISNGTHLLPNSNTNFWTRAWDQMMIELQCCGVNSGQDFSAPPFLPYSPLELYPPYLGPPVTCCRVYDPNSVPYRLVVPDCSTSRQKDPFNLTRGCFSQLMGWLDENLQILMGIGIGLGLVQIFGIIFALCLCMAIQSEKS